MPVTESHMLAAIYDLEWHIFRGWRNLIVKHAGGPKTRARLIAALPKYWPDEDYSPVVWPDDDVKAGRMAIRLIRAHVRYAHSIGHDWPWNDSQICLDPRIRRLRPLADAICLIAHGEWRLPNLRLKSIIRKEESQ